jgi:ribosome assembly protein YihI (activator of Der GTPase)
MSAQTNFRAVDMLGSKKPVDVVVAEKVTPAPKAKAPKATSVVVEEVTTPVEEVVVPVEEVVEEAAAPTKE